MISNRTLIVLYVVVSIILWYDFLYHRLPLTTGPIVTLNNERRLALRMTTKAIKSSSFMLRNAMHIEHLHHIPAIKMRWMMSRLLPCLSKVKIRNNTAHKKEEASAWVYPYRWGRDTIWINGYIWDEQPERQKAHTLIHECTHLVLNTLDYAYTHQEKYSGLRGKNATHNADSITEVIDMINYF